MEIIRLIHSILEEGRISRDEAKILENSIIEMELERRNKTTENKKLLYFALFVLRTEFEKLTHKKLLKTLYEAREHFNDVAIDEELKQMLKSK